MRIMYNKRFNNMDVEIFHNLMKIYTMNKGVLLLFNYHSLDNSEIYVRLVK